MNKKIKAQVLELIELNGVTKPDDSRIETCIADRFPEAYNNEQEYIEFQQEIAGVVERD